VTQTYADAIAADLGAVGGSLQKDGRYGSARTVWEGARVIKELNKALKLARGEFACKLTEGRDDGREAVVRSDGRGAVDRDPET
jgi:hypothetical protein